MKWTGNGLRDKLLLTYPGARDTRGAVNPGTPGKKPTNWKDGKAVVTSSHLEESYKSNTFAPLERRQEQDKETTYGSVDLVKQGLECCGVAVQQRHIELSWCDEDSDENLFTGSVCENKDTSSVKHVLKRLSLSLQDDDNWRDLIHSSKPRPRRLK